jgi:DNA polymerase III epsilon subunit-like protein
MLLNDLNELRDLAHRCLLEADRPVETQHIARRLFGPQRHEMPEAQVVVRSLLGADPRFLRTHCRRWSARAAPHMQADSRRAAFAVVDLDEIMEFGLVRIRDGKVQERFATRLRATRTVPPWVSRLTGLSNEDLADAPTLDEMAPRILRLLEDAVFVAHDIRFDLPFLRWELLRRDLGFPCRMGLCTLELSRALWPGLASHSLSELAASMDLTHTQPHRAGDDALAAAGVLQKSLQAAHALGRFSFGELMDLRAGALAAVRQAAES